MSATRPARVPIDLVAIAQEQHAIYERVVALATARGPREPIVSHVAPAGSLRGELRIERDDEDAHFEEKFKQFSEMGIDEEARRWLEAA